LQRHSADDVGELARDLRLTVSVRTIGSSKHA
jgi:hypothetical protein